MRCSSSLIVLFILIATPFVLAAETQINVKTLEFHKISVFVLDPDFQLYTLLESFHKKTDAYGTATFSYVGAQDNIKIRIQITDEHTKVINLSEKKYYEIDSVPTGSPLYYQMIPGNISLNYKALETSPLPETEPVTIENDSVASSVTIGHVVQEPGFLDNLGKYIPSSNIFVIGLGIFFGVGVIIFLIVKIRPYLGKKDKFYKPAKNAEPGLSHLNTQAMENELFSTQKKLSEAQAEINRIKNRDKIVEMQRKIDADRKELDRLKRGS